MNNTSTDLCVKLNDFRQVELLPGFAIENTQLQDGEVMIAVDKVALTANSISYALAGKSGLMRFLDLFPAPKGLGRIPCWGYGDVLHSKNPEVKTGQRLYGFFPLSSHIIVKPSNVTRSQFTDGQECKKVVAPFYSEYQFTAQQPGYNTNFENITMLFQPLFGTSYLLENYLIDHDFYGAEQVIVTSASSKTAMGFGYLLKKNHREKCRSIGLTSAANVDFVKGLNCFDEVLCYDDVTKINQQASSVLFDVAGNREVQQKVHQHLGEGILYSGTVGKTHWDANEPPVKSHVKGPAPVFWSGPDQLMKMRNASGADVLMQGMQGSMVDFLTSASGWIKMKTSTGEAEVQQCLLDFLNGQINANEGCILSLKS